MFKVHSPSFSHEAGTWDVRRVRATLRGEPGNLPSSERTEETHRFGQHITKRSSYAGSTLEGYCCSGGDQ
jgi:hypothetical protein